MRCRQLIEAAAGGSSAWVLMKYSPHAPQDFPCPGRWHMLASVVAQDTTRALKLAGVLGPVAHAFEATQVSNAMRSMPVEPGVVKSQSIENKLSWFVHLAPVQLFPALEVEHPHVRPSAELCMAI